jgi:hypothetical protein
MEVEENNMKQITKEQIKLESSAALKSQASMIASMIASLIASLIALSLSQTWK